MVLPADDFGDPAFLKVEEGVGHSCFVFSNECFFKGLYMHSIKPQECFHDISLWLLWLKTT